MKKQLTTLLLCILILNCHWASGQTDRKKQNSFLLYLSTPSETFITSKKANEIGISTHEWTCDFGLGYRLHQWFNMAGEVGFGGIKDYQSFSNNTTLGNMTSTFNTFHYNLKAGLWLPSFRVFPKHEMKLACGVDGGIGGFTANRSIQNCDGCDNEHFKFSTTPFIEPEVNAYFGKGFFGIGTGYSYYFSGGDVTQRITLIKLILKADN